MASVGGHLRPRTFFEILDGSVRHYRSRFLAFVLPFVPAGAIGVVYALMTPLSPVLRPSPEQGVADVPVDVLTALRVPAMLLGIGVARMAAYLLGFAVAVLLASGDLRAAPLEPARAWSEARSRFWALLGLTILSALIIVFGGLFLVLPGLYVAVRFVVAGQALLLEGSTVGRALGRSWELVQGHFWRAVGISMFLMLLSAALAAQSSLVGIASLFFLDEEGEIGNRAMFFLTFAGGQTLGVVLILLVAPLSPLVFTHFYWDLRVRKEGIDLVTRLHGLESPGA